MPTSASDRKLLQVAVAAVVGGLLLIAFGLILDPRMALLRHLRKQP